MHLGTGIPRSSMDGGAKTSVVYPPGMRGRLSARIAGNASGEVQRRALDGDLLHSAHSMGADWVLQPMSAIRKWEAVYRALQPVCSDVEIASAIAVMEPKIGKKAIAVKTMVAACMEVIEDERRDALEHERQEALQQLLLQAEKTGHEMLPTKVWRRHRTREVILAEAKEKAACKAFQEKVRHICHNHPGAEESSVAADDARRRRLIISYGELPEWGYGR